MNNLNINIDSFIRRRGTALFLAGTLVATCLAGCSGEKCEIPNNHAHMFVNDEGYVRYAISEKDTLEGYQKSYNTRQLSDDEIKLYEFMEKKGLLRINENLDLILTQQEENQPFTAYEYSEYHYARFGSSYRYYWTNNPDHEDLTGKEKEVHYIYQAYKVVLNDNSHYELIPAPLVEDITEVMEEYPYIKEDYFIIVDSNNVGVEVKDFVDFTELEMDKVTEDTDKVLKKSMD